MKNYANVNALKLKGTQGLTWYDVESVVGTSVMYKSTSHTRRCCKIFIVTFLQKKISFVVIIGLCDWDEDDDEPSVLVSSAQSQPADAGSSRKA